MQVIVKPSVQNLIKEIGDFIVEEYNLTITSQRFVNQLIDFGNQIGLHPEIYSICKYPQWAKKKLQCAIFKKKWVFAFAVKNNFVVIYHLKNAKLLNY